MDGSSLTHFPFARTKWAMRRGFRPCMINPLARSTSPLDYGCDTEEYSIWIDHHSAGPNNQIKYAHLLEASGGPVPIGSA